MSNFYNSMIKNRFLSENDLSERNVDKWNLIFSKTNPQEEILQKDIYQMNKQECETLLHFFKLRSTQHVNLHITMLKQYIYWCDSQGLIPHHINYFEGLGNRGMAKTFISNQVMENQIISKEKLDLYIRELSEVNDYQGALIIRLLFSGIALDQNDIKCELRNIKVKDIDFENKIIQTNKIKLDIDDSLIELISDAVQQEEMINLINMEEITSKNQRARNFNNFDFLINGRKTGSNKGLPTAYFYITKKIREIGSYVNNPHINATYLNLSGIIDYVKNHYKNEDYYKMEMYEDLKKIFRLEISSVSLKQKLLQFLI